MSKDTTTGHQIVLCEIPFSDILLHSYNRAVAVAYNTAVHDII